MLLKPSYLSASSGREHPFGLLLLRVMAGGFMLFAHGLPKLLSFSQKSATFPDPLGVGHVASLAMTCFAEVGCAALVLVGLYTRLAVLPLGFAMLVATVWVHAGDPFGKRELALLYLGLVVAIGTLGPGAWSIDALRRR